MTLFLLTGKTPCSGRKHSVSLPTEKQYANIHVRRFLSHAEHSGRLPVNKKSIVGPVLGSQTILPTVWFGSIRNKLSRRPLDPALGF
jgi:hypothetical protein